MNYIKEVYQYKYSWEKDIQNDQLTWTTDEKSEYCYFYIVSMLLTGSHTEIPLEPKKCSFPNTTTAVCHTPSIFFSAKITLTSY